MTSRHTAWLRLRTEDATHDLVPLARLLIGEVMESARRGVNNVTRRVVLEDGREVRARFDGVTPIAEITAATITEAGTQPAAAIRLWIPQGFAALPCSTLSTDGWGFPIQQAPGSDQFAGTNLAPGLATGRWTEGGALGEVLFSQADGAGYPDRTASPLPAFYETTPSGSDSREADTVAWRAWRAEVVDFLIAGAPAARSRVLFNACNARRAVGGHAPMTLPLRGYYDASFSTASLIAQYGLAADAPYAFGPLLAVGAPAGYRAEVDRVAKDGALLAGHDMVAAVGTVDDTVAAWATGSELTSASYGADTQLDVSHASMDVATIQRRRQWIAYGKLSWLPPDDGLPILSWDGPESVFFLDSFARGPVDGAGALVDLAGLGERVHGYVLPMYTNRLYAMGRCIGEAPGLVMAAAVQRLGSAQHRVLVLTWDVADQYAGGGGNAPMGFWRLRLWYRDTPAGTLAPLHFTAPPRGAYDSVSNPTGWVAAGFVRMSDVDAPGGATPNVLTQFPRFNRGGDALAICRKPYWELANGFDAGGAEAIVLHLTDVGPGTVTVTEERPAQPDRDAHWRGVLACDFDRSDALVRVDIVAADYTMADFPWLTAFFPPSTPVSEIPSLQWSIAGAPFPIATPPVLGNFCTGGPVTTETVAILHVADGVWTVVDREWQYCGVPIRFRARAARHGALLHEAFHTENGAQRWALGEITSTAYATDRAGNWLYTYELGAKVDFTGVFRTAPTPSTDPPVDPSPFDALYGAWSAASFGDPAAMSSTPGDNVGLYPLGAL